MYANDGAEPTVKNAQLHPPPNPPLYQYPRRLDPPRTPALSLKKCCNLLYEKEKGASTMCAPAAPRSLPRLYHYTATTTITCPALPPSLLNPSPPHSLRHPPACVYTQGNPCAGASRRGHVRTRRVHVTGDTVSLSTKKKTVDYRE